MAPQRRSTSPRRQGCSVWESNRRRWATGSSEVGPVVFCLPVPSSESGFHPRPGGARGPRRVRCQVPLPRAVGRALVLALPAGPASHILLRARTHPALCSPPPCLIFKAILFSEIPSAVPSARPSFPPSLKMFQQGPSKAEQLCRKGDVEWSLRQLLTRTSFGCG